MPVYYVDDDAHPNGDHLVHVSVCMHLPGNRTYVGEYYSSLLAVDEARSFRPTANGCSWCCATAYMPGDRRSAGGRQ